MSDYKLAPVEPTAEMVESFKAMWSLGFCDDRMAQECYAAILNAAPAVRGEPAAWRYRMLSEDWEKIATIHPSTFHPDHKDLIIEPLYTAPPPAEQQPDVAGLVWALKQILGWRELRSGREFPIERIEDIARAALVVYRKGGE